MKTPSVDDLHLHVALSSLTAGGSGWAWVAKSVDKDHDSTRSAVWAYSYTDGLCRVTADGYGPAWPCVGGEIAFLRAVDGAPQVFVQRPDAGQAEQVSHLPEGVSSIEHWDKERSRMLVRVAVESGDPDAPKRVSHLPYKLDGLGVVSDQRIELHEVCTRSGVSERIDTGEGDVVEARWSPDGKALALVVRRAGRQRHLMDLWLLAGNSQVRRVTEHLPSISGLSWSPDGRYVAMAASAVEGDSVSHLYVWDRASCAARPVGEIEMTIPSAIQWSDDAVHLLATEAYRGTQRVVMSDMAGSIDVVWEDSHRQVFGMAAVGQHLGLLIAGVDEGAEFHRGEGLPLKTECVTSFNAWRRSRPAISAQKRSFDVPDGAGGTESVEGWWVTPAGSGPFPVLLDMHGGPHSMVTFEYERQVHWPVLVAQGWAILALNAVGSSSYGRAFAHRIRGYWGELDLPQWQAALSALQDENAATTQVACFGHSYGGYLAAWALCHDERLCAGVVSGAVINLESHTGTSDSGYYVGPYALDGELPHIRERYRRLSPLSHAEHISVPVLILQGDDDQRCPVGQGEELLAALIRSETAKAEMVLFPGGSHHVSSTGKPSHRVAYYDSLVTWVRDTHSVHRGQNEGRDERFRSRASASNDSPESAVATSMRVNTADREAAK